MAYIKNIEPEKVVNLGGLVQYMDGQVVDAYSGTEQRREHYPFRFRKGRGDQHS